MQTALAPIELLHEVKVSNPNIHIKGQHSYYSDCWGQRLWRFGRPLSSWWWSQSSVGTSLGNRWTVHRWLCFVSGLKSWFWWAVTIPTESIGSLCIHSWMWLKTPTSVKVQILISKMVATGMRAMIMPGVTIGETRAAVAANSVVTKDAEPYSIVGGSPAKVVKYRFDESVIDELISMKIYEG